MNSSAQREPSSRAVWYASLTEMRLKCPSIDAFWLRMEVTVP